MLSIQLLIIASKEFYVVTSDIKWALCWDFEWSYNVHIHVHHVAIMTQPSIPSLSPLLFMHVGHPYI